MRSYLSDGISISSSLTEEKGDGSQRKRCSTVTTSSNNQIKNFYSIQVLILEDWFDKNPYPKRAEREELSQILMVSCQPWKACFKKEIISLYSHLYHVSF